jgi:DNA mismatch endonuclease (patch repair protein)
MSGIRGTNTQPELKVRRHLHSAGLRYRLHKKGLPGRPDLVLPRFRTAVFVHGCFWHQHPGCRFATRPGTNAEFWQAKFATNRERDQRKEAELRALGWRVEIVWECEGSERLDSLVESLLVGAPVRPEPRPIR